MVPRNVATLVQPPRAPRAEIRPLSPGAGPVLSSTPSGGDRLRGGLLRWPVALGPPPGRDPRPHAGRAWTSRPGPIRVAQALQRVEGTARVRRAEVASEPTDDPAAGDRGPRPPRPPRRVSSRSGSRRRRWRGTTGTSSSPRSAGHAARLPATSRRGSRPPWIAPGCRVSGSTTSATPARRCYSPRVSRPGS